MSLSIVEYIQQFSNMQKKGVWEKLLEEGTLFTEFNREYSENFKNEHDAKMKQCFYNAQKCALFSLFDYYEGYALSPHNIPMHHAWLVDNMGKVIDPTWADMPDEVQYFGIHFPTSCIFELWDRTETADSLLYNTGDIVKVNW